MCVTRSWTRELRDETRLSFRSGKSGTATLDKTSGNSRGNDTNGNELEETPKSSGRQSVKSKKSVKSPVKTGTPILHLSSQAEGSNVEQAHIPNERSGRSSAGDTGSRRSSARDAEVECIKKFKGSMKTTPPDESAEGGADISAAAVSEKSSKVMRSKDDTEGNGSSGGVQEVIVVASFVAPPVSSMAPMRVPGTGPLPPPQPLPAPAQGPLVGLFRDEPPPHGGALEGPPPPPPPGSVQRPLLGIFGNELPPPGAAQEGLPPPPPPVPAQRSLFGFFQKAPASPGAALEGPPPPQPIGFR